jgi:hypothetical protein
MILLDNGPSERSTSDGTQLLRPRTGERTMSQPDVPVEALAKAVVTAAITAKDGLDADLFSAVRVGLMLSSGRPGVKKLLFVLTDRTNAKRRLECSLLTRVQDTHLLLLSDCRGKAEEVARVSLGDPAAADAARLATEKFVLETVEQFSAAALRP